ncbi:MAG: hypothetical protein MRJ93_00230 [Nitrososphaeraceae archaeon]|nr:hypothetical protein [Nitrososphaeraceae archaeon]
MFTRYEKKDENYFGLVELANSLIIYRRLILGYALNINNNNVILKQNSMEYRSSIPLTTPYNV